MRALRVVFTDVAETVDGKGKERTPKEYICCRYVPGHKVKSLMTVILSCKAERWGAIGFDIY